MFRITVEELRPQNGVHDPETDTVTERYRQTLDDIDLPGVIAAINRKKRVRAKKNAANGDAAK